MTDSKLEQRARLFEAWVNTVPVFRGWASYKVSDGLQSQLSPPSQTEAIASPFECASFVEAALDEVVPPMKVRGVKDRLRVCLKSGPMAVGLDSGKFAELDRYRDEVILNVWRQVKVLKRVG